MEEVIFPREVLEVSSGLQIEPIRLALGWGDWQLVATCSPNDLNRVREISKRHEVPLHVLGEVQNGAGVTLKCSEGVGKMFPLDSQRFTRDSWFTAGLESYIEQITLGPLCKA